MILPSLPTQVTLGVYTPHAANTANDKGAWAHLSDGVGQLLVTQEDKVKPFHGKLHAECGCRINSGIMVVNATTPDTAAMETVTVNASASTTHTNVAAL
jgi:hypothetical protein